MLDICYITIEEAIKIHQQTILHSGGGAMGHFDLGRLRGRLAVSWRDILHELH